MDKKLPARPHLDHLRGQAKKLASEKSLKLAEAQTTIARQNGFASWAKLTRHVDQLRGLEGAWQIARLEIEGTAAPSAMVASSRILFDGDRFRAESPEGTYEGVFSIDAGATPPAIDIEFVAGPRPAISATGSIGSMDRRR